MIEPERTSRHRKDPFRESRLRELNDLLAPVEEELVAPFEVPKLPIVFIVGPPRSATTLLAQILARTGGFSYVDNFVARFYMAPYLGMQIERVLEFAPAANSPLSSSFGVTSGWDGPHEFGYFWSRWFLFADTHKLESEELVGIDRAFLRRECAAMESVKDKPLFFKNLTCGLQLRFLADVFPQSIFVVCRRDPLYNMQSLLQSRDEVFGNRKTWFSLRPREYRELVDASPYDQVAGQIYFVLKDIESGSADLEPERLVNVEYEELCHQPRAELDKIRSLVSRSGPDLTIELASIPQRLECKNIQVVPDADFKRLREAAARFFPAQELALGT